MRPDDVGAERDSRNKRVFYTFAVLFRHMEDMNNRKLEQGLALPVMETFASVQGEGFHTGLYSYFIRVGGCDVGCHWCDVKESWDPALHPLTDVETLVAAIPEEIRTVVVTGGEPLMYDLTYLTYLLKKSGRAVHLETSGTGKLTGRFDWICLSPKRQALPAQEIYAEADELKVIVYNKMDFKFALTESEKVGPGTRLYLQPEWSRRERMLPEILDFLRFHPEWKLSVQTHKYLGLP